ncbi:ABC transporter permease [Dehalococcoidia bacterium]|nr:ABC transporter permease [Dehalococcoidia bacterium]
MARIAILNATVTLRRFGLIAMERFTRKDSILRRSIGNGHVVIGGGILGVITLIGLLPEFFAPDEFNVFAMDLRLRPPAWIEGGSWKYIFGTDVFGRDLVTRVVYGTRIVLVVAGVATVFGAVVGILLGVATGYLGGITDNVVTRIADVMWAFPTLLLAITIMAIFPPSILSMWLVLTVTGWVAYLRVIRGAVLALKTDEFVIAARAIGATDLRIMMRHMLPNLIGPISVLVSFRFGVTTLAEGSLSFLGLGVPPPQPSWGGLLAEGRPYLTTSWWLITLPGIALMIAVFGANQLGDGLRDVLDPRLRRKG